MGEKMWVELKTVRTCCWNRPSICSKKFPVTQLSLESIGSNLADTHKLGATVQMMWNQTWPLFKPPYLGNIILLCYLTFVSFFVGHGLYTWYPQILALSYPNIDAPLTICEAVAMTWSNQEVEIFDTVWVNVPYLFFPRTVQESPSKCHAISEQVRWLNSIVNSTTIRRPTKLSWQWE